MGALLLQNGRDEQEQEQELQQIVSPSAESFKLLVLWTDEAVGLLAVPICSLLSSSLTKLCLFGTYQEMEKFTKEQEHALHLLASLQELHFRKFGKLLSLPAGLHKLTKLRQLWVRECPAVQSLPEDGLPISLQQLDVSECGNEELKQQCRLLVGAIPKMRIYC
ncbi:putative disease resistance RPP13-like protein 3 [Hordeum vulgare]|nr:putative disease resistance RPP13-like protein 3 [Hordeum vulgare]KAI5018707.1 hypothetical protein ZWY2020_043595 [Hordeum vulgare]